jgi:anhydro-N-acetylmuramic acid kinase
MEHGTHLALGVMSGTSCDGLDLALCRFTERYGAWQHEVLRAATVPYDAAMRQHLAGAHLLDSAELIRTDRAYGRFIGEQIVHFLGDDSLRPTLISSHGHTVFHAPAEGYTLQIGHGADIAATTGIDTVCDLRSSDVALGGQGAPLVPMGDEMLFSCYDICLNLGGFANLSYRNMLRREAFDVCPVNLPINALSARLGLEFDRDGAIAASTPPDPALLRSLASLYGTGRPSLSREWVERNIDPLTAASGLGTEVLISTLTHHAAMEMARTINGLDGRTVLITGGGAHNRHLISLLHQHCHKDLVIPDTLTVNFKEAIVWAFLGLCRILGKVNIHSSYTGAMRPSVAGAWYVGVPT